MTHTFYLAPLRGVTVSAFREVFVRHFVSPEIAITPFIPTVTGSRIKPGLLKEVRSLRQGPMRVIPQVIGKDPSRLAAMLRAFKEIGHTEANLNLGCPWKFVARKGRGSGLLADAEALEPMLEAGCAEMPRGFSVKVRLGIDTPDLLARRVDLLNRYPLKEIIIHPRTAVQMYGGVVSLESFAQIRSEFEAPVVYNGDIFSVEDFRALRGRFPEIREWMLGRGLVADPFLLERIRGDLQGRACSAGSIEALRAFHDDLFARYRDELFGPAPLLGRMKELWGYLHEVLPDGETLLRSVQRCRSPEKYRAIADSAFDGATRLRPIAPRISL